VLTALAAQRAHGGSHLVRLSPARTAHWLLGVGEGDGGAQPRRDDGGAPPHRDEDGARPRRDDDGAADHLTGPPLWHDDGAADHLSGPPLWHHDGAAFAAPVDGDPPLSAVPPPGSLGTDPLRWRGPAARYGADAPAWRDMRGPD
jgi:hypothetical protein